MGQFCVCVIIVFVFVILLLYVYVLARIYKISLCTVSPDTMLNWVHFWPCKFDVCYLLYYPIAKEGGLRFYDIDAVEFYSLNNSLLVYD